MAAAAVATVAIARFLVLLEDSFVMPEVELELNFLVFVVAVVAAVMVVALVDVETIESHRSLACRTYAEACRGFCV